MTAFLHPICFILGAAFIFFLFLFIVGVNFPKHLKPKPSPAVLSFFVWMAVLCLAIPILLVRFTSYTLPAAALWWFTGTNVSCVLLITYILLSRKNPATSPST